MFAEYAIHPDRSAGQHYRYPLIRPCVVDQSREDWFDAGMESPYYLADINLEEPATSMSKALEHKKFVIPLASWTGLLNLILVVLLCWQLAQWTWLFIAPNTPQAVAEKPVPNPEQMLEALRSAHLFGIAADNGNFAGASSVTPLNLKLSGVFAATGKLPAVAIINVENKGDLPFTNGDTILPGVTLEQVNPDHIILRRSGVTEKLLLEQKGPPLEVKTNAQKLNVHREGEGKYSVSRSEFQQLLSDPGQLEGIGHIKPVPGQGVRIEKVEPGSLISQLGLRGGDMVRRINGQAVGQPMDLLRSYAQGGQLKLEGTHNGKTFEYNYTVR